MTSDNISIVLIIAFSVCFFIFSVARKQFKNAFVFGLATPSAIVIHELGHAFFASLFVSVSEINILSGFIRYETLGLFNWQMYLVYFGGPFFNLLACVIIGGVEQIRPSVSLEVLSAVNAIAFYWGIMPFTGDGYMLFMLGGCWHLLMCLILSPIVGYVFMKLLTD